MSCHQKKTLIDAFRCYWQVDCMVQNRVFRELPWEQLDKLKVRDSGQQLQNTLVPKEFVECGKGRNGEIIVI
jgi:hypothetical protein